MLYPALFDISRPAIIYRMDILAVNAVPSEMDKAVEVLAGIMDASNYDAGARLRFAANTPLIVKSYGQPGEVEKAASILKSAGFGTVVLKEGAIESGSNRFIVRSFSLDESRLHVASRQGQNMTIAYDGPRLLLRGTSIVRTSETEVEKSRKFSIGRAVLSGGIVVSKTSKKTREEITEQREGFLHLYVGEDRVVVFRETALDYSSLGPLLKPTRSANFAFIVAELRKRCPGAVYDETLLTRAGQAQLLGPLFKPEEYLDIAISVLAKSFLHR